METGAPCIWDWRSSLAVRKGWRGPKPFCHWSIFCVYIDQSTHDLPRPGSSVVSVSDSRPGGYEFHVFFILYLKMLQVTYV